MNVLRALVSALYLLLALGAIVQATRTRRLGVFLGGLTYAAGGLGALGTGAWWPLVVAFAAATILARLGADPAVDVRHDLPSIARGDVDDPQKVEAYLTAWLGADERVRRVTLPLLDEAWAAGFRAPPEIAAQEIWRAATPERAWRDATATDMQRLASASRAAFLQYLDEVEQAARRTTGRSAYLIERYAVPEHLPGGVAEVRRLIPTAHEQKMFLENIVADTISASRVRVLSWLYQKWHGERYTLVENRGAAPAAARP